MTRTKTFDKRKDYTPTFGQLSIGDAFTSVGESTIFIKTDTIYNKNKDRPFNTMSLDGDLYWSDDDEEIAPIQEFDIIIKK